jgi:hypothetical protein
MAMSRQIESEIGGLFRLVRMLIRSSGFNRLDDDITRGDDGVADAIARLDRYLTEVHTRLEGLTLQVARSRLQALNELLVQPLSSVAVVEGDRCEFSLLAPESYRDVDALRGMIVQVRTAFSSAESIEARLDGAREAVLGAVSSLGALATFPTRINRAERVFKLATLAEVLRRLSPSGGKWHCTHHRRLKLFATPRTLKDAARFRPSDGSKLEVALDLQVRYGTSMSPCEVHEADIVVYDSTSVHAQVSSAHVVGVVACRYRGSIPKPVLRELAFFSFGIRNAPRHRTYASNSAHWTLGLAGVPVLVAVPSPARHREPHNYWQEVASSFGVDRLDVPFP